MRDLILEGWRTASARAKMQPKECATMWKDFTLCISKTDRSIISTCSLRVYNESVGFGLRPNPSKSTANNRYFDFVAAEKFGNKVSVQNLDDDMNPCMNNTSSLVLSPTNKIIVTSTSDIKSIVYLKAKG